MSNENSRPLWALGSGGNRWHRPTVRIVQECSTMVTVGTCTLYPQPRRGTATAPSASIVTVRMPMMRCGLQWTSCTLCANVHYISMACAAWCLRIQPGRGQISKQRPLG